MNYPRRSVYIYYLIYICKKSVYINITAKKVIWRWFILVVFEVQIRISIDSKNTTTVCRSYLFFRVTTCFGPY
jgi:hypothetical protein